MTAIVVVPPRRPVVPIVVAVAHAGRLVPADLEPPPRLSTERLRQLEDPWVDRLVAAVPEAGATVVVTPWARAVVDVNRAPDELDPTVLREPRSSRWRTTVKARAGLGVVPTEVAGEAVYGRPLTAEIVRSRLALAHAPYHALLAEHLARLRRRFGRALLLDLHSMPETAQSGGRVDVAVGDRYGRSADPVWPATVAAVLEGEGLVVAHNRPYAGGYTTEVHGRPADGTHALQIELRRSLYMDEGRFEAHGGLERMAAVCHRLVAEVGRRLLAGGDPLAIAGE